MKLYIKHILEQRKQLSKEDYSTFSKKICDKVAMLDEFQKSANLLFFYPYLNEVEICPLFQIALAEGKNIYFPKVTGEETMDFIKINNFNDFEEGYRGIREPKGTEIFDKHNPDSKTLMILPGSVFDDFGNRCGYGKGYYDRYLSDCFENITKVGVCFSLQMIDEIPDVKPTDIPMDYVINEEKIIRRIETDGNVKRNRKTI